MLVSIRETAYQQIVVFVFEMPHFNVINERSQPILMNSSSNSLTRALRINCITKNNN